MQSKVRSSTILNHFTIKSYIFVPGVE